MERKTSFFFLVLLSLFLAAPGIISASSVTSADRTEAVWPLIEARLDQEPADTARHFILTQVRNHCGKDYHCLSPTYTKVLKNLERRFDLPAAILVCEELLKIARREKDLEAEANTYLDLSRFHGALGNEQLSAVNLDRALEQRLSRSTRVAASG